MEFLLLAVVVGAVGIVMVVLRHRQPRSMDASIDQFGRARRAISPEAGSRVSRPAPDAVRRDQRPRPDRRGGDERPG